MESESFSIRMRTVVSFQDTVGRFQDVEGFLLDVHGYGLMLLAEVGPGIGEIVEIGSFKGKSTCWLALGTKRARREKVTAVDHFRGSDEHQVGAVLEDKDIAGSGSTLDVFKSNIRNKGLDEYVDVIVGSSPEVAPAWNRPIRLLFIDADHSYDAAKLDFELWAPHVVPGGIVVFHDIGNAEGATRYYDELLARNTSYKQVLRVYGMGIVEKLA